MIQMHGRKPLLFLDPDVGPITDKTAGDGVRTSNRWPTQFSKPMALWIIGTVVRKVYELGSSLSLGKANRLRSGIDSLFECQVNVKYLQQQACHCHADSMHKHSNDFQVQNGSTCGQHGLSSRKTDFSVQLPQYHRVRFRRVQLLCSYFGST